LFIIGKNLIFSITEKKHSFLCFKVINAYSSGVQAHKELLRKNGLTPDAVEDMIDEVHEVRRFSISFSFHLFLNNRCLIHKMN
jgi:hypothetical protein